MTRQVAIVGNGPLGADAAAHIEEAEFIVRFNSPSYTPDQGGLRTDILFVVNSGFNIGRRLTDNAFLSSAYVAAARRIILPWHPRAIARLHPPLRLRDVLRGRKSHYTGQGFRALCDRGKEVSLLAEAFNIQCYNELKLGTGNGTRLIPSTGFIGTRYALDLFPQHRVKLYGFTWQGWAGHPWDREFQWLSACSRVILPPGASSRAQAREEIPSP